MLHIFKSVNKRSEDIPNNSIYVTAEVVPSILLLLFTCGITFVLGSILTQHLHLNCINFVNYQHRDANMFGMLFHQ